MPKAAPRSFTFNVPEGTLRLDNGVRVLVLPDETTDLVQINVRYAVGANEDPKGKEGLAHVVEHLMFEQRLAGEDQPPVGAALRMASLDANAYTVWDHTEYTTLASKDKLEEIVALEASRLHAGCRGITQAVFAREIEVVRNEMRARIGSAEGAMFTALLATIYGPDHPYGRLPGGDERTLSKLTLADVCGFMNAYYTPGNATVIVAGNVTGDEVGAAVGKWFSGLEARPTAPRKPVPDGALTRRSEEVTLDVEAHLLHVAWRLPPEHSADFAPALLGGQMLAQRLEYFNATYDFAKDISVTHVGGPRAPVLLATLELASPGDRDEALEYVERAASRAHWDLKERDEEFHDLRNLLKAKLAMGLEWIGTRAERFADYASYDPDGGSFGGAWERLAALTGGRAARAIEGVFDRPYAVLLVKARSGGGGSYTRTPSTFSPTGEERVGVVVDLREAEQAIPLPDKHSILGRARDLTLDNGLRVLILPAQSSVPVASVALYIHVGTAHDPPGKDGLARAALNLNTAKGRATDRVNRALSMAGISMDTNLTRDASSMSYEGMNIFLDHMLDGLERDLNGTSFKGDTFKSWHKRMKAAYERPSVRRAVQFEMAFAQAVYGAAHPYATAGFATADTLQAVGASDAAKFRQTYYVASNATLVIAGNIDPDEAERLARKELSSWKRGAPAEKVVLPAATRTARKVLGVVGERAEALQLRIGFPTGTGDEDEAARLVLGAMLDGYVSGIRTDLAASYGLDVDVDRYVGPGAYVIEGPIDPARGAETLRALEAAIQRLRDGDGFEATFVLARKAAMKSMTAELTLSRVLVAQLGWLAVRGDGLDHQDRLIERIASLKPEDVKKLVAEELTPGREAIVLQGTTAQLTKTFKEAGYDDAVILTE